MKTIMIQFEVKQAVFYVLIFQNKGNPLEIQFWIFDYLLSTALFWSKLLVCTIVHRHKLLAVVLLITVLLLIMYKKNKKQHVHLEIYIYIDLKRLPSKDVFFNISQTWIRLCFNVYEYVSSEDVYFWLINGRFSYTVSLCFGFFCLFFSAATNPMGFGPIFHICPSLVYKEVQKIIWIEIGKYFLAIYAYLKWMSLGYILQICFIKTLNVELCSCLGV